MLNPIQLRSFVAASDCGSVAEAARRLDLAQPTVSLHLQKLERELGAVLLTRDRGNMRLTASGRQLLPHARSLLNINQAAVAAVRQRCERIGAGSNPGIYILQTELRDYLAKCGEQRLQWVIDSNPVIARQLLRGELDAAVMEWWQQTDGFEAVPWQRQQLVLITLPDHPLAAQASVSRTQLAELSLLGGEPGTGTGRLLQAYFGGAAMPRVSRQLGSTEAVKRAVMAGLGVSLVMAAAVRTEVGAGLLAALAVEGGLSKQLYLIWRRDERPAVADYLLGRRAG